MGILYTETDEACGLHYLDTTDLLDGVGKQSVRFSSREFVVNRLLTTTSPGWQKTTPTQANKPTNKMANSLSCELFVTCVAQPLYG